MACGGRGQGRRPAEDRDGRAPPVRWRIKQLQEFWKDWNPLAFHETLAEQLPENQGGIDRRGWEWHYWNRKLSTGQALLLDHPAEVWSVAFSLDGTRLATAEVDGAIRVWDTATGRQSLTLERALGRPGEIRLPTGADWLVFFGICDTTPKGFHYFGDSVEGGGLAPTPPPHWVSVAYGADGHVLTSIAYGADGRLLSSVTNDGVVRVWDADTGQGDDLDQGTGWHSAQFGHVTLSPEGRRVASARYVKDVKEDGKWRITIENATTGRESIELSGHQQALRCLAFSPDGTRLACSYQDGTIQVWDSATGREQLALKGGHGRSLGIAFSPDDTRLACTARTGRSRSGMPPPAGSNLPSKGTTALAERRVQPRRAAARPRVD